MSENFRGYVRRGALIVLCGTIFGATAASASPIVWNLVGVIFDDGGTASGSFAYDAATKTYSSVNITTTAGSQVPGTTYQVVRDFRSNAMGFAAVPNLGPFNNFTPFLAFNFYSPLTASGGTIPLFNSFPAEGTCSDAGCGGINFNGPPLRFVSFGSVSTLPTPSAPAPGSIIGAVSATTNMGARAPDGLLGNAVNQGGLISHYISGVTDFDTYMASDPLHNRGPNYAWEPTSSSGIVDFNLGSVLSIGRMAVWNFAGQVHLYGSVDASFLSPADLGSFDLNASYTCTQDPNNPNITICQAPVRKF